MDCVEINGRTFVINRVLTKNKNASARLKRDNIVIGIPARWPVSERENVTSDLLKRAIKAIERGKWKLEKSKKLQFFHGQRVRTQGSEFEITFVNGKKFGSRIKNGGIEIRVAEHSDKEIKISKLVRREIIKSVMPKLTERINRINFLHFQSRLYKITVRDNLTRWGSCSIDGSISLNFKLLFMPEAILDYVIVHELAHTKHRSHGKRFWNLVERIIPDHKERRKWLRENSDSVLSEETKSQQQITDFIIEEPY